MLIHLSLLSPFACPAPWPVPAPWPFSLSLLDALVFFSLLLPRRPSSAGMKAIS